MGYHDNRRGGFRDHQGGRGNNTGGLHAAYNFVPLSRWVYQPDWKDTVSHDIPLEDGLRGHLDIRIHAHSPILVGREQDREQPITFHQLPDGNFAIPGSSLRGMIRNVIEIAAFGKLRHRDNGRLGVRDLTNGAVPFYRQYLTRDRGNQTYEALSKSGWLTLKEGKWQLTPCAHARVEQHELRAYRKTDWPGDVRKRPSAAFKYEHWTRGGAELEIKFDCGPAENHPHNGKKLYYRKAEKLGTGSKTGMLVFTGQPGPNKHMEFIFFDEDKPKPIELPDTIVRDFMGIHEESDEWLAWAHPDKTRNPARTNQWREQFKDGIPVFYLQQPGAGGTPGERVHALGLAQMFKLAYQHSVGDMIDHSSPVHGDEETWDLADLLFGTAHSENPRLSLRGRANFSAAVCTEAAPKQLPPKATILNSPKPTYYPNYVVQDAEGGQLKGRDYRTYDGASPEIRGWKRYPARPVDPLRLFPTLEGKQKENKKVQVRLQPLESGVEFAGKLRFHNINPIELGALAWALTWGDNHELRHGIGLGKPFGLGQISIAITGAHILTNKRGDKEKSWQEYADKFADHMDQIVREHQLDQETTGWLESEQLTQLLAMADPRRAPDDPNALRHPRLEIGRNDFLDAKKRHQVLPEYSPFTGRRDRDIGWRSDTGASGGSASAHRWLEQNLQSLSAQHHTPEDTILFGRLLAEKWQAMEDGDDKAEVLALIRERWEQAGRWDSPQGKAAKKAKAIYSPEAE
ncbi:MAG: TIGR03986 family type III CRISPR-associated RAMP protein [Gammaproteobacteria bacterium]